ncbi:MAG TPA: FtsX-like permease family protein [Streptosporangiaceae bacterium]|jgi:putative ABC transport system permease protein
MSAPAARGPGRRAAAGWRALAGTGGAAAAGLGVLVLACVFLAVSAPRQSLGVRTRALQHELTAAGPLEGSVTGGLEYTAFASAVRTVQASSFAAARTGLAANLARAGLPLAPRGTDWAGLATGLMPVTGAARPLYSSGLPPQLELLYRSGLSRYLRLAAGRLPGGAPPAGAQRAGRGAGFEIAVTKATAARFGLHPGSRIGTAAGVTLVVTGIVRPVDLPTAFWAADPVASAPRLTQQDPNAPPYWTGAGFISPAALPRLQDSLDPAAMTVSFDFPLALGSVTADQARTLGGQLTHADAQAGLIGGRPGGPLGELAVTMSSGSSGILAGFLQADAAAGQVLSLLSVSLTVIGAAVVLLGARILAERRRAEFAVMQARGASRWQLARYALEPGAVVTVLAAAAGSAVAVALTPGYAAPLGWWLAGLIVAAALAGLPLITARSHRPARRPPQPGQPAAGRRTPRRLLAELALIAAAVGGLVALRQPGPAAGSSTYVSLAPVLVAIPAVILVLRCYPVALRALVHLSRIRPGASALVGFARAAQGLRDAALPVFALVLALAVVALGTMIRGAVVRGQVAASWQRTGADAVINASASSRPLTPAVERVIAAVPGVQRTAAVIVTSGSARGAALTVAAVRPAQYQELIAAIPGGAVPAFAAARLTGPAGKTGAGRVVPVLASRAAAARLGRGEHTLDIGIRPMTVRVAGTIAGVPGVPAGPLVVLSGQALGAGPPLPSLLLAVGPHLDQRRLAAVIRRALPGATVAFRSTALAALTTAALPRSAYRAIAAGSAAAAVLSLLVVLMTAMLGARSREVTLARLRVMGLGPGQARWLGVTEALPPVLAAVAGGIAGALALAPLVGPSIDLSAFTGSAVSVPIRPELALLAAAAAGLVVVALASLAAETLIASRGRVLRARE